MVGTSFDTNLRTLCLLSACLLKPHTRPYPALCPAKIPNPEPGLAKSVLACNIRLCSRDRVAPLDVAAPHLEEEARIAREHRAGDAVDDDERHIHQKRNCVADGPEDARPSFAEGHVSITTGRHHRCEKEGGVQAEHLELARAAEKRQPGMWTYLFARQRLSRWELARRDLGKISAVPEI